MKFNFPLAAIDELHTRIKNLGSGLTRDEADQVGKLAVAEMKRLIASGQSPIAGPGISTRFAKYKNPAKYPGKRKPHTPVNLKLTGEMLDSLGHLTLPQGDNGFVAEIGYDSVQSTLKESGHREGVFGQPPRPTIPDHSRGETFASSIVDAYRKVMVAAFRKR